MKTTTLLLALVALVVTTAGCEKKKTFTGTRDIGGKWGGNFANGTPDMARISLQFTQGSSTLSGSYLIERTAGDSLGNLEGTIYGNEIDFVFKQTSPCEGTFTAGGDYDGAQTIKFSISADTNCYDITPTAGAVYAMDSIEYHN